MSNKFVEPLSRYIKPEFITEPSPNTIEIGSYIIRHTPHSKVYKILKYIDASLVFLVTNKVYLFFDAGEICFRGGEIVYIAHDDYYSHYTTDVDFLLPDIQKKVLKAIL